MKFGDRLVKLLEVKSLITLITAVTFAASAFTGVLGVDHIMLVVSMVFTYFFNRKEAG